MKPVPVPGIATRPFSEQLLLVEDLGDELDRRQAGRHQNPSAGSPGEEVRRRLLSSQ
jgi:hypothetical protein